MAKASRSLSALPAVAVDQLQKLGHDLTVARKRRKLSLREMAERMMVNLKTVERLEKGILQWESELSLPRSGYSACTGGLAT